MADRADAGDLEDLLKVEFLTRVARVPRVFRDRSNPLEEFEDREFGKRYRLSKESVLDVLKIVESDPEYPTQHNLCCSFLSRCVFTPVARSTLFWGTWKGFPSPARVGPSRRCRWPS